VSVVNGGASPAGSCGVSGGFSGSTEKPAIDSKNSYLQPARLSAELNKIEQKVQAGDTYTTTEQRCMTAYDTSEVPNGYDVTYVLDGKHHHVHMDHDPGKTIPLKDGHIVADNN